jgi:LAO/AO transport system kinase
MTQGRIAALCAGLVEGDRRAVARLLTYVEDGDLSQRRAVVAGLPQPAVDPRVIGLTGAPGVGKSSVTTALIGALRATGRRVAVLAIDPSSPFTGGALLGDRIRMQSHHADDGVYIRSMAARGRLGGLASAVPEALMVLAAAGFDEVIIETVGVGQSEIDVIAFADTTLVVTAPGLGDAVQAAKAGVLEIADILVVNKSDLSGAGRLESELKGMLELGHLVGSISTADWVPPVLRTVAVRGEGIDALLAAIEDHGIRAGLPAAERRRRRARRWLSEAVIELVRARLAEPGGALESQLAELAQAMVAGTLQPFDAVDGLVVALGLDRPAGAPEQT